MRLLSMDTQTQTTPTESILAALSVGIASRSVLRST